MNPTGKIRKLEIELAGQPFGEIEMRRTNGHIEVISGGNIIPEGDYSMKTHEMKDMVYNKVAKKYIKIKQSKSYSNYQ